MHLLSFFKDLRFGLLSSFPFQNRSKKVRWISESEVTNIQLIGPLLVLYKGLSGEGAGLTLVEELNDIRTPYTWKMNGKFFIPLLGLASSRRLCKFLLTVWNTSGTSSAFFSRCVARTIVPLPFLEPPCFWLSDDMVHSIRLSWTDASWRQFLRTYDLWRYSGPRSGSAPQIQNHTSHAWRSK
jgi:hypothetical protein